MITATKACRTCGAEKPVSAFNKKSYREASGDGLQSSCTPCRVAVNRKRTEAIRAGVWVRGRHRREWYGTPQATCSPTIKDLYWAAGFLEGEGSFSSGARCYAVTAAQVQREPLERLQRMFGGRVTLKTSASYMLDLNRNLPWSWSVFGGRARGVAMTLYALMSPKRKRQIRVSLGYSH